MQKTKPVYITAKKKLDAMTLKPFSTLEEAQMSIPKEAQNEKWYCFAKYKDAQDKIQYTVVSYYDIISPLGDVTKNMQWFNAKDYLSKSNKTDAENKAIKTFKSLKV